MDSKKKSLNLTLYFNALDRRKMEKLCWQRRKSCLSPWPCLLSSSPVDRIKLQIKLKFCYRSCSVLLRNLWKLFTLKWRERPTLTVAFTINLAFFPFPNFYGLSWSPLYLYFPTPWLAMPSEGQGSFLLIVRQRQQLPCLVTSELIHYANTYWVPPTKRPLSICW